MKIVLVLFLGLFILGCSWDMKGQGKGTISRNEEGQVTGVDASGESTGTVKENE